MNFQKRLHKLRKKIGRKKLDAVLISQPENRRYLSGYTGGDHGISESSGVLLIPRKGPVFSAHRFSFQNSSGKRG